MTELHAFASKQLFVTGLAVGLKSIEGLLFDADKPYTGCRVCGAIYQTAADRHTRSDDVAGLAINTERRRWWSIKHAKTHSDREHLALAQSGNWCTPEAARKLAAFGIVPISDMVMDDDIRAALLEAPSVPNNDVEG